MAQRGGATGDLLVDLAHREQPEELLRLRRRRFRHTRHDLDPRHSADPRACDLPDLGPGEWPIMQDVDDDVGVEEAFAHAASGR